MNLTKKTLIIGAVVVLAAIGVIWAFLFALSPADASNPGPSVFEVAQGEGFREVAAALSSDRLIRSAIAFDAYALIGGRAFEIKPGLYRLAPSMSGTAILDMISGGNAAEVSVTIPEGSNVFEEDAILSNALVIRPGDLVRYAASSTAASGIDAEGMLFPDTYRFYTDSDVTDVADELHNAFHQKAMPLLADEAGQTEQDIVIASILEKEVPDQNDREIVAGIILKRLAAGMPLDIDATVCYAKLLQENSGISGAPATSCTPLAAVDFKINSAYNTYLYKGLPPGPIGNPGVSAITAALHPQSSPYWYYLSDPKTGKTIFAKTLDEQNQNRVKYLESD